MPTPAVSKTTRRSMIALPESPSLFPKDPLRAFTPRGQQPVSPDEVWNHLAPEVVMAMVPGGLILRRVSDVAGELKFLRKVFANNRIVERLAQVAPSAKLEGGTLSVQASDIDAFRKTLEKVRGVPKTISDRVKFFDSHLMRSEAAEREVQRSFLAEVAEGTVPIGSRQGLDFVSFKPTRARRDAGSFRTGNLDEYVDAAKSAEKAYINWLRTNKPKEWKKIFKGALGRDPDPKIMGEVLAKDIAK